MSEIKYAKIVNEETKLCSVAIGTNPEFYESIGMTKMDVEQAYNGRWYVDGYAPKEPEPTPEEKKQQEIAELERELASTDDQILYCAECQMAGESLPDSFAELHKKRQEIRDQIKKLK